jgi:HPt (histidine-containing phosphotransfer) domain-containing protein
MGSTGTVLDVRVLRCNTLGDNELLGELIDAFQQDLTKVLEAIDAGVRNRDRLTLSRAAHKVKGSLLVVGANCASTAEALEREALVDYGPLAGRLSVRLKTQLLEVVPALKDVLDNGEL